MLDETGELVVAKRCAFCGAARVTLVWRPLAVDGEAMESSPMTRASLWPMDPVRDAKMWCASCLHLSYGWLVGARLTGTGEVDGHFIPVPKSQLVTW